MAPKASGPKAIFSHPLQTQADDVKYKTKYKELKAKLTEVEEDNLKLALRIQKSKKAIQRLRIERSIVYDRLQSTTTPTNPYSLNSTTVANAVVAPGAASAAAPTSLAEVQAKRGVEGVHGEEPRVGVVGESTVGNGLGEVKREVGAEGMEVDR